MPKKSIPSRQGPDGRAGSLAHLLTERDRLNQDARLDPIIKEAWGSGILDRFRAEEGIKLAHRRLAELLTEAGRALAAEDGRVADRVAMQYVREHENVVLAMASAGDARRLIPVDLWARIPPRYRHTDVTSTVFQCMINLAREQIGLFTRGKLLQNRHYTLLLAHLLVFPEEIHQAGDLSAPYPWPFLIRLDPEGTPYLDVQVDAIDDQRESPAKRLAAALAAPLKQAGALNRGSTPTALDRRARKQQAVLHAGMVANELYPRSARLHLRGARR